MLRADPEARPALALAAYFFAYIPMLLGVVALAAGVKLTIVQRREPLPAGPCVALGCGVALFLAGHAAFRQRCGSGPSGTGLAARRGVPGRVGARRHGERRGARWSLLTAIVAVPGAPERRGTLAGAQRPGRRGSGGQD